MLSHTAHIHFSASQLVSLVAQAMYSGLGKQYSIVKVGKRWGGSLHSLWFGTHVLGNLTGTQNFCDRSPDKIPIGEFWCKCQSCRIPFCTIANKNKIKKQMKKNSLKKTKQCNRYTQIDKNYHWKCGLSSHFGSALECYTFWMWGCANRRPDFMRLRAYTRRKSAKKTKATPKPPTMVTAWP